ncbi:ATP synthase F1 subunit epsilon [bacterium]|nr:ATP synthase F1 subunit epsilon [bacterium]
MKNFRLKIITPEKIIFDNDVVEVVLPTKSGQVGILATHVPYLAPIQADELQVYVDDQAHQKNEPESFAVDFGLAEFVNNQLVLLVAQASPAADIDIAMAQAAQERAKQLMEQDISEEDYTNALAMLERDTAKIKVATKYRLKHRVS